MYNTLFSRAALAFFEARKRLLEQLVVTYKLNVLHLDADTVWFANPYPIFKTLYKDYQLIIQTGARCGISRRRSLVPPNDFPVHPAYANPLLPHAWPQTIPL